MGVWGCVCGGVGVCVCVCVSVFVCVCACGCGCGFVCVCELVPLLLKADAGPEPRTVLLRRVAVLVHTDGEQEILYLVRLPSPLVPATGKRIMTEHWSRLHGSGLAQYRHSTHLALPPAGFNES